jgi:hypothetical protein
LYKENEILTGYIEFGQEKSESLAGKFKERMEQQVMETNEM